MRATLSERLLRGLYSVALYALVPFTLYHLVWRGFRQRAYFERWGERYGMYGERAAVQTPLWLHAVSVGEVNAAVPLVNALLAERPEQRMVITSITPTGSERIRALWGDRVEHVYLPYDLPGAVSRFLRHFRPQVALIMETELWPNLLFGCRDAGVPTVIINARLSARSLRGYQVLGALIQRALATVACVCAQSRADAQRFVHLGAKPEAVHHTGNLKFDVSDHDNRALVQTFRECAGRRPTWIAASTHPEEELPLLLIHKRLRQRWPELLMIWAPRHPERFKPVAEQVLANGLRLGGRSRHHWPRADDAVFLLDTLGELANFYAAADVAFVGGSLQPIGGHNLLEPAASGVPVLSGPHLHNFAEIAARLREAGALRVAEDANALEALLENLMAEPDTRAQMGEAGKLLVADGRGALVRTLQIIEPLLPALPAIR